MYITHQKHIKKSQYYFLYRFFTFKWPYLFIHKTFQVCQMQNFMGITDFKVPIKKGLEKTSARVNITDHVIPVNVLHACARNPLTHHQTTKF